MTDPLNWYALFATIINRKLTADDAFIKMGIRECKKQGARIDLQIDKIAKLRETMSWQQVSDVMGIDKKTLYARLKRTQ